MSATAPLSAAVAAQSATAPDAIRGRVVDAATGAPVADAEVTLRVRLPSDTAARGRLVEVTSTDASGAYGFDGVPAGRYDLDVTRPGYRTRSVAVAVGSGARPRVSVALEVAPIELTPVEVEVPGRSRVIDGRGREVTVGRVGAVRLRQERFLTSDSRTITAADVEEAATLGEPDVFRALQRLPGVSTRDDFTAELWTRGADWGETRVYLDGIPLFNPVHGFGVLSGVNSRLVASATLHPGVQPVAFPEGAAAVVDLRSRSGIGEPAVTGGADVSLASAQAWAAGPVGTGGGWSAGVRRSWIDVVAGALARTPADRLPYMFWDAQAQGTVPLASGHTVTAGLLVERDEVTGELPDVLHNTAATWGNAGGTVALEGPFGGGLRYRLRAGGTAYDARVSRIEGGADTLYTAPEERPADHAVRYATVTGRLEGAEGGWAIGGDVIRQTARYEGPETWPYSTTPPDLPLVADSAALTRAGVWARGRWRPIDDLTLETAIRVDGGDRVGGGRLTISPRVVARLEASEGLTLSAGVGRSVQYAQSPAPVGPRVEAVLQTGRRWILADAGRAPVRSRVATVGGEAWLSGAWLASVTAYGRRTTGLLLPDPTPGLLVQRPPLVAGRVHAAGIEASVRRLVGRVTGAASWSLSRARAHVVGLEVAAPTDRTHLVDLSATVRVGRRSRLSGAFTFASGAPFTRVVAPVEPTTPGVVLDDPFGRRGPAYASLDLVWDQGHDVGGWTFGWFVQLRNVLMRDNAGTYRSTSMVCPGDVQSTPCPGGAARRAVDRFSDGMPTLPLIGLRVTF